MKVFRYTIRDELGLHARPASLLSRKAEGLACDVTIIKDGKKADAKRLFSIMGLGVRCGDTVKFKLEGENEEEEAQLLKAFCEEMF